MARIIYESREAWERLWGTIERPREREKYPGRRPYTSTGGKSTSVRVQRPDKPGVTETRMWGSYEKVSVKRATEEGKR
jgi:hypothetical protein